MNLKSNKQSSSNLSKNNNVPPRWLKLIAILLSILAWLFYSYCAYSVKSDDSYIYYNYVQNLINGNGFVFNIGERVNGSTSILFPMLVAVVYFPLKLIPGVSIPFVGHSIGFISLFFCLILGSILLEGRNKKLSYAALFFPLILLTHTTLCAAIGMETYLTLALMLATLFFFLKEKINIAALFSALCILSRPDTIVFLGVLGVCYLIKYHSLPGKISWCIFFGVLFPSLLAMYFYFGSILPNTLSAKLAQSGSVHWGDGFLFLRKVPIKLSYFKTYKLLEFSILALTLITILRLYREKFLLIIISWGALYIIAYGLVLNAPGYKWYYVPPLLTMSILLAITAQLSINLILKNIRKYQALISLIFLIFIFSHSLQRSTSFLKPKVYAKHNLYKSAAEWLNSYAPENSSLASNEIGVLGYYYKRGPIIDGLGLITPSVIPHVATNDYSWYVRELKPNYLLFRKPPRKNLENFTDQDWFKNRYKKIKTLVKNGAINIYEFKSST